MNKTIKKSKLIIMGIILFLVILTTTLISGLIYQNTGVTGKIILKEDSQEVFTKAICDSNNYCRDYVYTCKNENLISIMATEASVQHSPDWRDFRKDEIKYKSCSS